MCLAILKHLRWIWLKQPQNNSKIGLTHACLDTHNLARTHRHTLGRLRSTSVSVGPFVVFLAGHSSGNEYQIWFCSHKSKPSAVFCLSFLHLQLIHKGSVHWTYTPRLSSFLWNRLRAPFRSKTLRKGRRAAFKCTSYIMYSDRKALSFLKCMNVMIVSIAWCCWPVLLTFFTRLVKSFLTLSSNGLLYPALF